VNVRTDSRVVETGEAVWMHMPSATDQKHVSPRPLGFLLLSAVSSKSCATGLQSGQNQVTSDAFEKSYLARNTY
jgi:hypothetical protein